MAKEHEPFLDETCSHCYSGKYRIPDSEHVSYVECDRCGAIHLTYLAQDYQEEFHSTPYELDEFGGIKMQIIGTFGGRKSVASN